METAEDLAGEKCEFKVYRHSQKKDGNISVETVSNPFARLGLGDKDSPYALIVNRFLGEKNQLKETTLQINSRRLMNVFREVIGFYPTVPADFTSPFELKGPFQILLHYWEELDERRQTTKDADERMHLNLLLDFMKHEIGPERERLLSMLRNKQITYKNAWCIFRPGDLIYTEFMGHPWLLRCQKTAYEESTTDGQYMEVHCLFTDHDGTITGENSHVFRIFQKRSFAAENPAIITKLPCFPRKFVEDQWDLENRLIARGERFLTLQGISVMSYDGHAQYLKEPDYSYFHPRMADFDGVWLPYTELGRVILDRKTFQEDQYSNAGRVQAKTPDPLCCPPYEYGFSLSRKEWCRFFIDSIRDVKWKENAWDSLIIGDHEKLVLQSLVTSHSYPEDARDQSLQKGKGLVVLLHGSPGSGKTLTAETAAEGSKRAIMMTSLGELNKSESPAAFEYRLKLLLQYATTWKAVVLMDEADVFLEAREDHGDTSYRNALVAVFLKELEYFSGIVFLTTNRIKSFDKAMKSRIHLALEYTPPGLETRERLWLQMLKSIPSEENCIDFDEAMKAFVLVKMNGREIANAVHTARTIARFQKKPVGIEHIEMVLGVWKRFDESLQKIRQGAPHPMDNGSHLMMRRTNSIIEDEKGGFNS
ncbi:ATPase, AAA-type, core [Penicillium griseofulvum]|uniref:ATPase, AAA-type, core n=1 Tax=Penicillium patulum TaxID=5078 RepID=A0A135LZW4_PENPA|nr:ATPase, AAA-type, core [Penicillium griseofulvum]KXG54500.1 ATPase, AAA-type, core [Penicillium griseofulvum]